MGVKAGFYLEKPGRGKGCSALTKRSVLKIGAPLKINFNDTPHPNPLPQGARGMWNLLVSSLSLEALVLRVHRGSSL